MKSFFLIVGLLVALIIWSSDLSFGQCPTPHDAGICDTVVAEVYAPDTLFTGTGHSVRVPVYVTHDLITEDDSLAGVTMPLCFTHSNPSRYCSTSSYWNTNALSGAGAPRSIFRHFNGMHNWMMDQFEDGNGEEWDTRIASVGLGYNFWFSTISTGADDQRFEGGSRVLWFTMTFKVEDTMTICIDTCFWPSTPGITFTRQDATSYHPRDNMLYCFFISPPARGDVNADGVINSADVVFVINYLYREGSAPNPVSVGDTTCDEVVNVGDVVFLINYLYRGGPAPSC